MTPTAHGSGDGNGLQCKPRQPLANREMNRPDIPSSIEILRRLAVGGMSEVFLARQTPSDGAARLVVVKRLLPGAGEEGHALFRREREAIAAIDSPFVVRLMGGSEEEIVLEFVDGADLATLLAHLGRRGKTLPIPAALAVMEGILAGLRDLHAAQGPDGVPLGLVHRDLSPGNVLVSRDGAVKLTDLGVVHRDVAGEPTLPGFKGTLAYMAPEQLRGEGVDLRTDLYAAGLIAYEVLTGVPARPAGLQGLAELFDARSRLPAPPSEVLCGLPEGLDAPVLRALEPDRSRRFRSATEMWQALQNGAGSSPDRDMLARAVREVTGASSSVARTLGPERVAGRMDTIATRPPPGERPRRFQARFRRAAMGLAAAGLVVAGVVLVRGGLHEPPDNLEDAWTWLPDARSSEEIPAAASESEDLARPDDPTPVTDDGSRDEPVSSPEAMQPDGGLVRPREPTHSPARPASVPPVTFVVAPAGEGAVHVSGDGLRGLAPVRVSLTDRKPILLDLRAGPSALLVRVRVEPRPGGPVAFVGAPEGRYHQVACGGVDLGATPVGPVPIGDRIACRVVAPDGSVASFALETVER